MKTTAFIFTLLLQFATCILYVSGQAIITTSYTTSTPINNNNSDSSISKHAASLTIVYDILVKDSKRKTGIEETYNGGIKTIFITKNMARIRLVSLMRIQSIFISSLQKTAHPVSIIKESGIKKYKCYLTNNQWNNYNNKYEKDSCIFTSDSAVILNYPCRKVIIQLKDGRKLSAYYTDKLHPITSKIEPAFNGIPGLVLQYQYDYKKGSVIYTASFIDNKPIDKRVFKIPVKGYRIKKYCADCKAADADSTNNDNDTDAIDSDN